MAMVPRVRTRRTAEERRKEIITAAITLFARQGFTRTTTKQIAAEAGIAEGTIYKYFASKQEILFAFVGPKAVRTVPAFFDLPETADDREVLRAFIHNRLALWEREQDLVRVIVGESLYNPELAEGMNRAIGEALSFVEGYIARRVAAGAFRPVEPTFAARSLVSLIFGYLIKWVLLAPQGEEPMPIDALADECATLFLDGVRQHPDSLQR